jgi:hypothetical protein
MVQSKKLQKIVKVKIPQKGSTTREHRRREEEKTP